MRAFLLWSLALLPILMHGAPLVRSGDVLALTGDSITQQGMYSVMLEDYVLLCGPVRGVKVIQCGWGGTTAPYMADHMKDGILKFAPTVATTAFGMNDGNMTIDTPKIEADYRDGLNRMIDNFQKSGTRLVIVGSPGCVDTTYFKNPRDQTTAAQYNETLGRLTEVARDVAAKHGLPFADLHTPLLKAMKELKAARGDKIAVCGEIDGVHATPNGHLCMAYAFLKAMGYDGDIGTITYDAANGSANSTEGHQITAAVPGRVTIVSSRYPFCFTRGADHSFGPVASILPYLPFNEELNRFIFIAKNLKARGARITWGDQSKEFTAAQLDHGINLAAEFLKNPFCDAFAAMDKKVSDKMDFQIHAITFWLGQRAPALTAALPEKAKSFTAMETALQDINAGVVEDLAQAVKPVTHTILIEELK